MTKKVATSQMTAAAEVLADYVLTKTKQYHTKATVYGVEYYTYYLTAGQEADVAFAVDNFLSGKSLTLEVCDVQRPPDYKASRFAWTITREIASRATKILREVGEAERIAALAETFAQGPRKSSNSGTAASRN